MGARSFDDEIAQVPSRDHADRYFAPNNNNVQLQHIMTHSLWRSSAVLTYLQNASLAPPVIPATFAAIIPHHIKLGLGF